MGYIRRNNLKQFPDTIASRGKGSPERFKQFCVDNDIVSWTTETFSPKVRGKHGCRNEPPFHDHSRIYFKRNGDQICVIHEYVHETGRPYEEIRRRSIAWAEKWGYICEVYPPERGWYFMPEENNPGAACVVFHRPGVEVIIPK